MKKKTIDMKKLVSLFVAMLFVLSLPVVALAETDVPDGGTQPVEEAPVEAQDEEPAAEEPPADDGADQPVQEEEPGPDDNNTPPEEPAGPAAQPQTGSAEPVVEALGDNEDYTGEELEFDQDENTNDFIIASADDLAKLAGLVNAGTEIGETGTPYAQASYIQTGDIDLAAFLLENADNYEHGWIPIGTDAGFAFEGTYDGNGKTITGARHESESGLEYVGLFGYIKDAAVTGLHVEKAEFTGPFMVGTVVIGAVVGQMEDSVVTNCVVTDTLMNAIGLATGGLIGMAVGDFEIKGNTTNSTDVASITGNNGASGGIVGSAQGTGNAEVSGNSAIGYIAGNFGTGGIVGVAGGVSIVNNSVDSDKISGVEKVGGIVGKATDVTLKNNWVAAEIEGEGKEIGGIAGLVNGTSSIDDNVALNMKIALKESADIDTAGRIVGDYTEDENENVTLSGNYAWADMPVPNGMDAWDHKSTDMDEGKDGTDATLAMLDMTAEGGGEVWDTFTDDVWNKGSEIEMPYLDGREGHLPYYMRSEFEGNGKDRPYEITDEWALLLLADLTNTVGDDGQPLKDGYGNEYRAANYILKQDLHLSGIAPQDGWVPIGSGEFAFTGTFDGNDKTINGLQIAGDVEYAGLFGRIDGNAELTDIALEGVSVRGGQYAGGLVGLVQSGQITGCSVTGSVKGTNAGGLAGAADLTIQDETGEPEGEPEGDEGGEPVPASFSVSRSGFSGSIEGLETAETLPSAAGIAGTVVLDEDDTAAVSESYSAGTVDAPGQAGGIVGAVKASGTAQLMIENCYSTANVSAASETNQDTSAGGVLGAAAIDGAGASVHVEACYTAGDVFAQGTAGGIAGSGDITIENCAAVGWNVEVAEGGTAGRILGDGSTAALTDNYAWDGMEYSGKSEDDPGDGGDGDGTVDDPRNGTDADVEDILDVSFWNDTLGWSGSGAWTIESGKLPQLANNPGEEINLLPTDLKEDEDEDGNIVISWTSGHFKQFDIYRALWDTENETNAEPYEKLNAEVIEETSYTDEDYDTGVTYSYIVTIAGDENDRTGYEHIEVSLEEVAVEEIEIIDTDSEVLAANTVRELPVNTDVQLTAKLLPARATKQELVWSSSDDGIAEVDNTGKVTAIAVGTATVTVETADGQVQSSCEIKVIEPVTDIVLNDDIAMLIGEKLNLTAVYLPKSATNREATWTSDNEAVATVDENGRVTAHGAGTATITATSVDTVDKWGGTAAFDTCVVTVKIPVSTITLNSTRQTLQPRGWYQLAATVGPDTASNKEVKWYSANDAIAIVDATGKVTATGASGAKTTVTAEAKDGSGVKASCEIIVGTPVSNIGLVASPTSVLKGAASTVTATVLPIAASNELEWTVSDGNIASISGTGTSITVTGKKAGTVTITARAKDGSGVAGTVTVTVRQLVTSLSLSPASKTIITGKTVTVAANASPGDASNKAVSWKSSNTKIATVNASGVVKGVKPGKVTITATAKDGSGKKATMTATVNQAVTKVSLKTTKGTFEKGTVLNIKPTVKPTDAKNKKLTWTSSNTKVAKVNSSGKVTTVGPGKVVITATAKDGSGKSVKFTLTVTQKVTKITLSKKSVITGKKVQLKPTVKPANATNQAVKWKSSDKTIATVSSSGYVKGIKPGKVTITATAKDGSGKKATCVVTVKQAVTAVKLNKSSIKLSVNKTYTLKATVKPSKAANKSVKWKSANTSIATVDSKGKVTGVSPGTTTITATAKDGSGKKYTCTVTVK